jgi:hypothetical protein
MFLGTAAKLGLWAESTHFKEWAEQGVKTF